jgi:hypothetical protein
VESVESIILYALRRRERLKRRIDKDTPKEGKAQPNRWVYAIHFYFMKNYLTLVNCMCVYLNKSKTDGFI